MPSVPHMATLCPSLFHLNYYYQHIWQKTTRTKKSLSHRKILCTKFKSIHTFTSIYTYAYTTFKYNSRNFDWQPEWKIELHFFQRHEKKMQGVVVQFNHLKKKLWKCWRKKNNFLYILSSFSFYKWKNLHYQLNFRYRKLL